MIPFNRPTITGEEVTYVQQAIHNGHLCGDGFFSKKCHEWLEKTTGCDRALLTPSCTHALELSAVLLGVQEGDEVIMPSYTFSSTANAFLLRGAKAVFVDIRPDTMNIDESLIEAAITNRTKGIVVVHYAGVACEMASIMALAERYHLFVVEDAAQGVMARYHGRHLGSIGHLGCYSFHETKNYTSGEGGALLINDPALSERAEIIREKGTNRRQFLMGHVDKYSWVDIGSSFLPSELNAAYLYAQLERAEIINQKRLALWQAYYNGFEDLTAQGWVERPTVPAHCDHNAHIFYIKVADGIVRSALMAYLKELGISAVFHYIPLHQSAAGKKWGRFHGVDRFTSQESERLVRLPLYYDLELEDVQRVVESVHTFFHKR
ncbi:dTDP-4-amino-4,6-dideoxygalactose transaminase [Camelliibacillus cellulosilyticus]|uniref:dTDP-4-amino-4,6-dideoxygalactose transaminase n=1 Tax=Camelliibacillus cellulosilyticus TaxID=2174486 RepID=A0ABV9GLC5_9BACL